MCVRMHACTMCMCVYVLSEYVGAEDVLLKERLENLKRQFRDSNKQHVNMEELLEKGKVDEN